MNCGDGGRVATLEPDEGEAKHVDLPGAMGVHVVPLRVRRFHGMGYAPVHGLVGHAG